jgi:hypothetical protein
LDDRAVPATLAVNGLLDNTIEDHILTLREAVAVVSGTLGRELSAREAAQVGGAPVGSGDTINFAERLFSREAKTLRINLGQFAITKSVSIEGPGASKLTIDAQSQSRIFNAQSVNLALSGFRLTGGQTTAPLAAGRGGAIQFLNGGTNTLRIDHCRLEGNHTTGFDADGGAVFTAGGGLVVSDSVFCGNSTAGGGSYGGAIASVASVSLTSNFFTNNATLGDDARGGAVAARGASLAVKGCLFLGNSTSGAQSDGGALAASGDVITLTNSFFLGNSATGTGSDGGGIVLGFDESGLTPRTVDFTACLVLGNSVADDGSGGGIALEGPGKTTLTLTATIVAGNSAGVDANFFVSEVGEDDEIILINSLIGP